MEFMLVEQQIYLSRILFSVLLVHLYKSAYLLIPTDRSFIFAITAFIFTRAYWYGVLREKTRFSSFNVRSTIDLFPFAASALGCLFFELPNRSSQPNFKLFQEYR